MKTETLEQWKARTGKEPRKVKIEHNTAKFYYSWITRGKLKLKNKPRLDHDKNLTKAE
jgi:hypothetical protein